MYDLMIVGAGPAGMTAALYALRAGKSVLLLDGSGYGGQIAQSQGVENYPGIPFVNGMDLADSLMGQIRDLGVDFRFENVTDVNAIEKGYYEVRTDAARYEGRTVILATGLQHRKLNAPGEDRWVGRGISFCAVCDGAFFRQKEVAVIGGGNTAIQDALYLAEICAKVYLIHRREGFRAEIALLEKARANDRIEFITNTVVAEFCGDTAFTGVRLENKQTGELRELAVAGVFEAVGLEPRNQPFAKLIPLDGEGYAQADEGCGTPLPGVFVAGDCRAKKVRQLTTATADGTVAALAALEFLDR